MCTREKFEIGSCQQSAWIRISLFAVALFTATQLSELVAAESTNAVIAPAASSRAALRLRQCIEYYAGLKSFTVDMELRIEGRKQGLSFATYDS